MRREIKEMASREYAKPREGRRRLAGAFRAHIKALDATNLPVDPRTREKNTPQRFFLLHAKPMLSGSSRARMSSWMINHGRTKSVGELEHLACKDRGIRDEITSNCVCIPMEALLNSHLDL
jgi:hypothetical protein